MSRWKSAKGAELKVIAAALIAALVAATPQDNEPLFKWSIISTDRSHLIAADTKPWKLGVSGMRATMLTINADYAPGSNFMHTTSYEIDCLSKRYRSFAIVFMSTDGKITEDHTRSEWAAPAPNTILEQYEQSLCKTDGPVFPKSWIPVKWDSIEMVRFYFKDILGFPPPSMAP